MITEKTFFGEKAGEQAEFLLSLISNKDYPSKEFTRKILSKLYRMPKSVVNIFIGPLRDFYYENIKNIDWVEMILHEGFFCRHPCSGDLIHLKETLKVLYELDEKHLLKIWNKFYDSDRCAGAFIFFFPLSFVRNLPHKYQESFKDDILLREELEKVFETPKEQLKFLGVSSSFAQDYLKWRQDNGGHFWTFAVEKRILHGNILKDDKCKW